MPPKPQTAETPETNGEAPKSKRGRKKKEANGEKKLNGKEAMKQKKIKSKHKHEKLHSFLRELLKQVHPEYSIGYNALSCLDSIIKKLGNRMDDEAYRLAKCNKRKNLKDNQMEIVVRMLFPGELSKHAMAEGQKAMIKYTNSKADQTAKPKKAKSAKKA